MKVTSFNVNVTSEHPEQMLEFYREVVGLTPNPTMGDGAFDAGGTSFFIDGHSQTKGPARSRSAC